MSDIDLLNESLAGEHFGIAAYDAALGSGLLDEPTADVALAFQSDHKRHRDLLAERIDARGGTPVAALGSDDYAKSYPPLTSAADVLAYRDPARGRRGSVEHCQRRRLRRPGPRSPRRPDRRSRSAALGALLAAAGANPVPSPIIAVDGTPHTTYATGSMMPAAAGDEHPAEIEMKR